MRYFLSVLECRGDEALDTCWGPYPYATTEIDKTPAELEPSDFFTGDVTIGDVWQEDDWLMIDTYVEEPDGTALFNWFIQPA